MQWWTPHVAQWVPRKGRCGCPGPAHRLQFYGEGAVLALVLDADVEDVRSTEVLVRSCLHGLSCAALTLFCAFLVPFSWGLLLKMSFKPVNVEASVSYPVKTLETGPQPQLLQEIES